jgi:hypothetical protein
VVVPTGLSTATFGAFGKANIYAGYTEVPYFLVPSTNPKDTALNTGYWKAAGVPEALPPTYPWPNRTSTNLTRFNPIPKANALQKIPLLVSVPNGNAAGGACTKPANGWPVVIYQHGITTDRSTMIAVADGYADGCMVVAAIDLPLHGITPYKAKADGTGMEPNPAAAIWCNPANPSPLAATCMGARERTFDVDLAAPTAAVDSPDYPMDIDPSGTHFINLTSPLTSRDNLREAEADLIQLTKSVPGMVVAAAAPGSLPAGPVGVNATHVSFVGTSMGGIVGGSHLHFVNDVAAATLNVPGGVLSQLAIESPAFGPPITAGLNAKGLAPGNYLFGQFMRDFQAVLDSADPINHIADAVAMHPTILQKVIGDTVVPNNATDRLIAAGGFVQVSSGMAPVLPGEPKYTAFPYGTHGSLFSPAPCASIADAAIQAKCVATTTEMQRQVVIFTSQAAPNGTGSALVITDTSVVQ